MHTITRLAFLTLIASGLLACGSEPPPAPAVVGEQRIDAWALPIQDGAGQPDLALAPDGRVLLSWINSSPGRRPAVQMAEWYPDDHWEGPRTVVVGNSLFVNWADTPHIAATPDRALWLHWLQKSPDSPDGYDIKLVRSLDHGMNWGAPRQVHNDRSARQHGFVAFWPQGENSLGVAWLDGHDTATAAHGSASGAQATPGTGSAHDALQGHDGHGGGATSLRAAVFDANLSASTETVVDAHTCDCCQTAAAPIAGGALLVYRDRSEDDIRDIYAVRFDGKTWSTPTRVHADNWKMTACPMNGPAVAAQGERAVVAWYTVASTIATTAPGTAAGDRPMIKLAASADSGATFAPPVVVDEGPAVLGRVALAMDAKQIWLVWMREEAGRQSLWLARYAPALGKPLQRIELAKIEGSGRAAGFPKIVVREGIAHVVWTEAGESGPRLRGMRVALVQ
jgi:hypothetical protein